MTGLLPQYTHTTYIYFIWQNVRTDMIVCIICCCHKIYVRWKNNNIHTFCRQNIRRFRQNYITNIHLKSLKIRTKCWHNIRWFCLHISTYILSLKCMYICWDVKNVRILYFTDDRKKYIQIVNEMYVEYCYKNVSMYISLFAKAQNIHIICQ